MKRKRSAIRIALAGAAVLLFWGLGGCAKASFPAPSTLPAASTPAHTSGDTGGMKPLLSSSEREMVHFFYFLLELDQGIRTGITLQQAEAMLPVIKRNVEDGAMKEGDRQTILATLYQEQQTFYVQWLERRARPVKSLPPEEKAADMTDEEKEQWRQEWIKRTGRDVEEGEVSFPQGEVKPGSSAGPYAMEDRDYTEKNVEQQLVELLVKKTGQSARDGDRS